MRLNKTSPNIRAAQGAAHTSDELGDIKRDVLEYGMRRGPQSPNLKKSVLKRLTSDEKLGAQATLQGQMLPHPPVGELHMPIASPRRKPRSTRNQRVSVEDILQGAFRRYKVVAEGVGLNYAVVGVTATFRVLVRNRFGLPVTDVRRSEVKVYLQHGPGSPVIDVQHDPNHPAGGAFVVRWSVPLSGTYDVAVSVRHTVCKGSPFKATVEPACTTAAKCRALAASSKAYGSHILFSGVRQNSGVRGDGNESNDDHPKTPKTPISRTKSDTGALRAAVVAGLTGEVAITACDQLGSQRRAGGDHFAVAVHGPGRVVKGEVTDQGQGKYTLAYMPRIAGVYRMNIYLLPPRGRRDVAEGKSLFTSVAVAEASTDFLVSPRGWNSKHDHEQARIKAVVAGATPSHASIDANATPDWPEEWRIAGCPVEVEVIPAAAYPAKCTAVGDGAYKAIAGQDTSFRVWMRDRFGNRCKFTGGSLVVMLVPTWLYQKSRNRMRDSVLVGFEMQARREQEAKLMSASKIARFTEMNSLRRDGAGTPEWEHMPAPPQALTQIYDPRVFSDAVVDLDVADCLDGSYICTYNVSVADTYDLVAYLNGGLCNNMRHDVVVAPAAPFAPNCVVSPARRCTEDQRQDAISLSCGQALTTYAGETVKVRLRPYDALGNQRPDFGDAVLECRASIYRSNAELSDGDVPIIDPELTVSKVTEEIERPGEHEYVLTWRSEITGSYLIRIALNGEPIAHAPFLISVRANLVDPHSCEAMGSGLFGAIAGELTEFSIIARDNFGNMTPYLHDKKMKSQESNRMIPFIATLYGPLPIEDNEALLRKRGGKIAESTTIECLIKQAEDGHFSGAFENENWRLKREKESVFTSTYTAIASGLYRLNILCNGVEIKSSPYTIDVQPNVTCEWQCELTGTGYHRAVAGNTTLFTIVALDRHGNTRWIGGDRFVVRLTHQLEKSLAIAGYRLNVEGNDDESLALAYDARMDAPIQAETIIGKLRDNGDGTYLVDYVAEVAGLYYCDILLDGKMVRREELRVIPNHARPNRSSIVGQGSIRSTCGERASFRLVVRDLYGNRIQQGGSSIKATVKMLDPRKMYKTQNLFSLSGMRKKSMLVGIFAKAGTSEDARTQMDRKLSEPDPVKFFMCRKNVEVSKRTMNLRNPVIKAWETEVKDQHNGRYEILYSCELCTTDPAKPLTYRIFIEIDNIKKEKSLYCEPTLYPAVVDPDRCVLRRVDISLIAHGDDDDDGDLEDAMQSIQDSADSLPPLKAGERAIFLLEARDRFGNLRHVGGEEFTVGLVTDVRDYDAPRPQSQRSFGDGLLAPLFAAPTKLSGGATMVSDRKMILWANVTDIGYGLYSVKFRALDAGTYSLTASHILVKSEDPETGHREVRVRTFWRSRVGIESCGADPRTSLLSGLNLLKCMPNQPCIAYLLARDSYGNPAQAKPHGYLSSADATTTMHPDPVASLEANLLHDTTGETAGIVAMCAYDPRRIEDYGDAAIVDPVCPDNVASMQSKGDTASHFKLMWSPRALGKLRLEVLLNGEHVMGSPVLINCESPGVLESIDNLVTAAPLETKRSSGETFPRSLLEVVQSQGPVFDADSSQSWRKHLPSTTVSAADAAQGPMMPESYTGAATALMQAYGLSPRFVNLGASDHPKTIRPTTRERSFVYDELDPAFGRLNAHRRWRFRARESTMHAGIYRMAHSSRGHAKCAEHDFVVQPPSPSEHTSTTTRLGYLRPPPQDDSEQGDSVGGIGDKGEAVVAAAPTATFPLPLPDKPVPYRKVLVPRIEMKLPTSVSEICEPDPGFVTRRRTAASAASSSSDQGKSPRIVGGYDVQAGFYRRPLYERTWERRQ